MTHTKRTLPFALFLAVWCGTSAFAQQRDLSSARASLYPGAEGRRLTVVCRPGSKPENVWGTDVYTADSSICTAAAHAGIISLAEGGVVTAVITTGRTSYGGSTQNGITSQDFGAYRGSFTIEDGDGGQIDWSTKAVGVASLSKPLALVCPPEGATTARVWGTDTYSDDTPICVAAVHAGVITAEKGGKVVVESAAGRTSYRGTSRNGVTSESLGAWPRSFRFEGMVAESEATTAKKLPSPATTRTAAARGTAQPTAAPTTSQTDVPPGNVMAVGTKVAGAPAAVHPTGFTVSPGYGRIVLKWKPTVGAKGYRLARNSRNPASQTLVAGSSVEIPALPPSQGGMINDTTYTDSNVTTGVQYVYWLDTFFEDQLGALYSPPPGSNPTGSAVPRDPAATGFTVFAGYGRIQLDWKPVAEAKGFRLTRKSFNPATLAQIPGTEIQIPNRPASSGGLITDTTFLDTNVTTGVGYAYRLATFFEDRPGTVYTPASAVNPALFAVPRDPVGMPWLPAGWESAPVLTTTEIAQRQDAPDYTLAWNMKGGAIGYLIRVEGIPSEYGDWFESDFRDRLKCYSPNGLVPVAAAVPGHTYLSLLPRVTANAPWRYQPRAGVGYRYYTAFCAAVYAVYPDALDPATGTPRVSYRYNNPSLLMLPEGSVVSRPAKVMFRWIYPLQTGRYWEIVPPDKFSH